MATKSGRTIEYIQKKSIKTLLVRWETLLVFIFLAVNAMNISLSPNYLNAFNLFTNINNFLVKGFVALPMAYILLLGDIDLSVGANVCLSGTIMGIVFNATNNIWLAILACLACGTLCGAINGLILTNDSLFQTILQTAKLLVFLSLDLGRRNLGPEFDDASQVLHGHRRRR